MRNFDCATESKGNYLYQPYDFLLMSARIPAHWHFHLIDAIADQKGDQDVLSTLKAINPQIMVLAMADTNWSQDVAFLIRLQKDWPHVPIYICGDAFWEAHSCREVERFCAGIIDNPLLVNFEELLAHPTRLSMGIKHPPYSAKINKSPQQVSLGLPRHKDFLNKNYRWPFSRYFAYTTVFTSWGCPYSCSYCIMSNFPNIWRSADEILIEMRDIKKLGVREIYIGDRSFGLPKKNIETLLRAMINENFNFSWSTYFRVDQYEPELLALMAQSGCHTLIVGFETFNEKNLANFNRQAKPEKAQQLVEHANRLKINICGDFIIGLPGDTKDDVQKTISWACRMKIQYASFNVAAPLAGTVIRHEAIQRGVLDKGGHHYDSLGLGPVLSNTHLTAKEIKTLRTSAILKFYLRPLFLIRHFLNVKNFQHFCIQAQEAIQLLKKASGFR